jgi:3-oxoacyl-[acyl-carrier-protein] synthase-3
VPRPDGDVLLDAVPAPGGAPAPAPVRPRTAGFAGLGVALPAHSVPTTEVEARLGLEAGWVERRTGIRARRHAADGETVASLAADAGRQALDAAGLQGSDLDLVLVATATNEVQLPNVAPVVAGALGSTAGAVDLGSACAGFLSGLALGTAAIEAGRADAVLLVGSEVLSRWLDHDDRRTAPLFGDGAGAAVLTAGSGAIGPVALRSAPELADLLIAGPNFGPIVMEGHETFVAAVNLLTEMTREALERAELGPDDIDLFVFHQANARILKAVAERLGLDPERMVDVISQHGNTSAASVPIGLAAAARDGRMKAGDRLLLGAVGAGFNAGACVVDWGSPA